MKVGDCHTEGKVSLVEKDNKYLWEHVPFEVRVWHLTDDGNFQHKPGGKRMIWMFLFGHHCHVDSLSNPEND